MWSCSAACVVSVFLDVWSVSKVQALFDKHRGSNEGLASCKGWGSQRSRGGQEANATTWELFVFEGIFRFAGLRKRALCWCLGKPKRPSAICEGRGIYFRCFFVFFFFVFFRFWLLGFLASWLFGFLASWLFGFLASWFFCFSASGFFGFLLVYAAFSGFLSLAFRILCIPRSSSALVYVAFGGFGFSHPGCCTLSLVFGFGFPHHE